MDDTLEQILSPTIKEEPQLQIFPGDEGCQENIQVSAFNWQDDGNLVLQSKRVCDEQYVCLVLNVSYINAKEEL